MKHPLPFLITSVALLGVYPIAIWVLHYQRAIALGFMGILGLGAIFGSLVIIEWWAIIRLYAGDAFYIASGKEKLIISWPYTILVGSLSAGGFGFIFLLLSYFGHWSFKTFYVISLLFPVLRFLIYWLFRKRAKRKYRKILTDELD